MSIQSKTRDWRNRAASGEATGHRPRATRELRVPSLFCRKNGPLQRPAAAPGLHHRITREA
ncbi:MAG: hypothetical protein HYU74_02135 [Dechloromonas sp.]|nr:hypothetical protein [Dechloromonas sp.]